MIQKCLNVSNQSPIFVDINKWLHCINIIEASMLLTVWWHLSELWFLDIDFNKPKSYFFCSNMRIQHGNKHFYVSEFYMKRFNFLFCVICILQQPIIERVYIHLFPLKMIIFTIYNIIFQQGWNTISCFIKLTTSGKLSIFQLIYNTGDPIFHRGFNEITLIIAVSISLMMRRDAIHAWNQHHRTYGGW